MTWPTGYAPFSNNRTPLLAGLSATDGKTEVPVAVDPTTGELLVGVNGAGLASTIVSGQQTATNTAAALPSHTLTQGVVVEALSTNSVSVFIGPSGVTSSTGIELPPGAAVTLAVSNSNAVSIVCASSSPVVTFIGA